MRVCVDVFSVCICNNRNAEEEKILFVCVCLFAPIEIVSMVIFISEYACKATTSLSPTRRQSHSIGYSVLAFCCTVCCRVWCTSACIILLADLHHSRACVGPLTRSPRTFFHRLTYVPVALSTIIPFDQSHQRPRSRRSCLDHPHPGAIVGNLSNFPPIRGGVGSRFFVISSHSCGERATMRTKGLGTSARENPKRLATS